MAAVPSPPIRLGAFSFAIFTALGIFLPFWPLWLQDRGWSPEDIGILLSANFWVRALGSPVAAEIADRTNRRRTVLIFLAWTSVPIFALFWIADSFTALILVSIAFGILHPPLMPLSDNVAMLGARRYGFRYGRIRLWGSLGFLAAASLGGLWFTDRDPDQIFVAILVALVASGCVALLLPDIRVEEQRPVASHRSPLRQLLGSPRFLVFLTTVGLIQASHSTYYAFSTIHWTGLGLDETTVGFLWSEGVVAEIALFYFASRRVTGIPAPVLFGIGATGAVIRWLAIATATTAPALAMSNWLHAVSFGVTHLAAIQFVDKEVPDHCSATAQSLMSAVSVGLFMAPATWLAGELYTTSGTTAFAAMAAFAGAGGLCALVLWRMRK